MESGNKLHMFEVDVACDRRIGIEMKLDHQEINDISLVQLLLLDERLYNGLLWVKERERNEVLLKSYVL